MIEAARYGRRSLPSVLVVLLWLAAWAIAVLAGVAAFAEQRTGLGHDVVVLAEAALAIAIATIGARIVIRGAQSPAAWIVCGLGVVLATSAFSGEYVAHELAAKSSPGALAESIAVVGYLSLPAIVLTASFLWLLRTNRRREERDTRFVVVSLAFAGIASLAFRALVPGPLDRFHAVDNPLGLAMLHALRGVALWAWVPVACTSVAVSLASQREVKAAVEKEPAPADPQRLTLGEPPKHAWGFLRDFPRVFPYLRPYWKLGISSASLLALGALAGLLSPWPLAILIDGVLTHGRLPTLLRFLGGLNTTTLLFVAVFAGVLVTAVEHGVGMGQTYVDTALEQRMGLDVRSDLFRHIHRLSQAYHDGARKGMLMYVVTQSDSVGSVTVSVGPILQSLGMLIGMFVIACAIDPELALLSLAVVPFIYYSTGYYTKRIEPRLYYVRGLEGQALSIVYEALAMVRVIVAFGREKHEYGRFRRQGEQAVDARIDLTVRQTFFSLAVSVLTAVGTALVLGVGGWHVLRKELTVGELLVVMYYITAVYTPLQTITSTLASLQQDFINMRMVLGLLDTPPDIEEDPDAISVGRASGNLVLEDVSFTYEGREETLQNISFAVGAGQRVGIVGPTGAGKSTLVSLLPRFYNAAGGQILLDGIPIQKLTLESLRQQFSVVHQEPMLFSGSIADNIRYGRLEATEEEVIGAARAANAHSFISALPNGYETELGEGGPQLSGGERQRLAVARAFLKDAPILILDEPTSSIDSGTEAVILDALQRLIVGRTTITIAHRLGTLRGADLILVMDHGQIVERGTHSELIALGGLYTRLYAAQSHDDHRDVETSDLHERMVQSVTRILDEPALTLRERAERAGQVLRDAELEMSRETLRDASGGRERP